MAVPYDSEAEPLLPRCSSPTTASRTRPKSESLLTRLRNVFSAPSKSAQLHSDDEDDEKQKEQGSTEKETPTTTTATSKIATAAKSTCSRVRDWIDVAYAPKGVRLPSTQEASKKTPTCITSGPEQQRLLDNDARNLEQVHGQLEEHFQNLKAKSTEGRATTATATATTPRSRRPRPSSSARQSASSSRARNGSKRRRRRKSVRDSLCDDLGPIYNHHGCRPDYDRTDYAVRLMQMQQWTHHGCVWW